MYLGKLWQEQLQMERSSLAGAGGGARLGSGMGSWLHTDVHTWNTVSSGGQQSWDSDPAHLPLHGAAGPGCKHGSEPSRAQGAALGSRSPTTGVTRGHLLIAHSHSRQQFRSVTEEV